jgi:hypothetical protein
MSTLRRVNVLDQKERQMLFNPQHPNVQARSDQFSRHQFKHADETPHQRARHGEIKLRYDFPHKERQPRDTGLSNFRKAEMEMLFIKRYRTYQLPNDDAGRDDLRLMVDHLMMRGEDHARRWAALRAPWMPEDELDDMIDDVGPGRWWTKIALGKALRLTNAERMSLDIRTFRPIDRTKKQLDQDRRERNAARERERRAKAGAKPRAMSEAQTKPWLALGISESTYRRRKRDAAPK